MQSNKAAIIGIGKTGLATAAFLAKKGVYVALTDQKPTSEWKEALSFLYNLHAQWSIAPYDPSMLADVDLVVPSPGVYPANPILVEAVRRGIPIWSELELAFRYLKTPLIAITGTNGKTTTTSLLGEILRKAGKKVFVGGNIGDPLIGYTDGPQDADWAVVEVSSFQLQWVRTFHPQISILLNVTPDHIDYHGSLASYRETKERIFANQTSGDLAILNGCEEESVSLGGRLRAQKEFFSSAGKLASGIFIDTGKLILISANTKREDYPLEMINLPGRHNLENVMAAIIAARFCGAPPADIIEAVKGFRGLPHRIEYVCEKKGVKFYDDSKGTNVGAVVRAIESFKQPIILLLGGRDKEGDFQTLIPFIKKGVKEMVLFGEARQKINDLIGNTVQTSIQATLKEAVKVSFEHSAHGDAVLLSPGCASFDEFNNYKERGDCFQEWVKQLV
jgi:UDP-N-acetylmuramoylalanine--D-glutamate ligase